MRGTGAQEPRINNPARLFFQPVEPFLIDAVSGQQLQARVARKSLAAIWTWISRDLVPAEAQTFSDAVAAALVAGLPSLR